MQSKSFSRLWIFSRSWSVFLALALAAACIGAHAQDLKSFEQRTTVKVLPNGLTLIICERHEAPVFSYTTFIDAGDVNDPSGESGLAHMFEHLAFKGTTQIGTTDYAAEKVALEKVEAANDAYEAEYLKPVGRSEEKLKELHQAFLDAQAEAEKYVIPNQFTEVAERERRRRSERRNRPGRHAVLLVDAGKSPGAVGVDGVEPPGRRRSARVLQGARRGAWKSAACASTPIPSAAWWSSLWPPPTWPTTTAAADIGWPSEVSQINATEAMAFHKKYYVGGNIVVAIVGDVDAKTAMPMLEKYFSRVPGGPKPEEMTTVEPTQFAEKSVIIREQTQPFYIEGYHRPSYRDPDDAVYDAISDIMSNGRVSRLYRSLVEQQQIAAEAEGFSPFPGEKYPSLFAFYAVPAPRPHAGRDARRHSQRD